MYNYIINLFIALDIFQFKNKWFKKNIPNEKEFALLYMISLDKNKILSLFPDFNLDQGKNTLLNFILIMIKKFYLKIKKK